MAFPKNIVNTIGNSGWRVTLNAPVSVIFVGLCVVATLLNMVTAGGANELLFSTYHSSLLNPLTWVRFFTHVFGHAGIDHMAGNMAYILLLAPMLEEKYGSRAMIEVIALTGLITGLVNYLFFPHVALCGASGVVFAFILLSSLTSFREKEIPITFVLVVIFFLGQQVYLGLFVQDNISNMAHIVGGIVGAACGFILNKEMRSGETGAVGSKVS